jgi:hypothetical protein
VPDPLDEQPMSIGQPKTTGYFKDQLKRAASSLPPSLQVVAGVEVTGCSTRRQFQRHKKSKGHARAHQ